MSILGIEGGQLGDIICLDSDCDFGRAAVQALKQTFVSAGSPNAYAVAVAALTRRAADHEAKTHWPFSNYCCAWKDIGTDAQQLTANISRAAGFYAPPPPPPQPSPTETIWSAAKILLWSVVGLTVVIGGSVAYSVITSAKRGDLPSTMTSYRGALAPHPARRSLPAMGAYRRPRRWR